MRVAPWLLAPVSRDQSWPDEAAARARDAEHAVLVVPAAEEHVGEAVAVHVRQGEGVADGVGTAGETPDDRAARAVEQVAAVAVAARAEDHFGDPVAGAVGVRAHAVDPARGGFVVGVEGPQQAAGAALERVDRAVAPGGAEQHVGEAVAAEVGTRGEAVVPGAAAVAHAALGPRRPDHLRRARRRRPRAGRGGRRPRRRRRIRPGCRPHRRRPRRAGGPWRGCRRCPGTARARPAPPRGRGRAARGSRRA